MSYLNKSKLQLQTIFIITKLINKSKAEGITHVRLNIYPDGGVSRFRIFGLKVSKMNNISIEQYGY